MSITVQHIHQVARNLRRMMWSGPKAPATEPGSTGQRAPDEVLGYRGAGGAVCQHNKGGVEILQDALDDGRPAPDVDHARQRDPWKLAQHNGREVECGGDEICPPAQHKKRAPVNASGRLEDGA